MPDGIHLRTLSAPSSESQRIMSFTSITVTDHFIAIQAQMGIPVKYIGVGEKIDDLQKFDADSFVKAIFDID